MERKTQLVRSGAGPPSLGQVWGRGGVDWAKAAGQPGGAETGVQGRPLPSGGLGRRRPSTLPGYKGLSTGVFLNFAFYFHGAWRGRGGGSQPHPGQGRAGPKGGMLTNTLMRPLPLPLLWPPSPRRPDRLLGPRHPVLCLLWAHPQGQSPGDCLGEPQTCTP